MVTDDAGKKQGLSVLGSKLTRWAAGLALLSACLACLVSPFLAVYQARQPFPGFMVEPTMVISAIGRSSWSGRSTGLEHPWRVVAADEQPLARPADLNKYLQTLPLGTPVQYTVEDAAGRQQIWPETISSSLLPTIDAVLMFWIPYFVALAYLACGIWVYWARRNKPQGRACTALCTGVALGLALIYDTVSGHYLSRLWIAALPLGAAGAVHLGLVFPEPLPLLRRVRWVSAIPYLLAAGLISWSQIVHASPSAPRAYIPVWRWIYLFASIAALFFVGSMAYTRRFARITHTRQQARSVLLGSLLAFLPTAACFGAATLKVDIAPYLPFVFLAMAVFPFTLAYSIAREHLLDVDRVVSRGLAYSLLAVLLIGSYIAMTGLVGWLAPGLLRADDPLALAFLVILAALLASPLQRYLRRLVDRLLYRERVNFRRVVQEFGHSLAQVIDLPELSHLILQRISETLHLDAVSLYLFDPRSGTYQLYEATGSVQSADPPAFAETDPFIQHLRVARGAVYRHHQKGDWLRRLPLEEKTQVNKLYALAFLPLATKNRLIGWLNLGARLSGEGYTSEDLELLNALADRAAVAVENARLFAERERRLTELAVLNEIGQAINSALSLEQVLETIYRETGRLMDTTNFYIALYDPDKEEASFPLVIEDEHQRFPSPRRRGKGLTEYLLRTQQPLLIAERVEETIRSLGIEVIGRPAVSWLGVPILHEDQAIGIIAVQSTRSDYPYDVQDLNILSAIANQAAIAIENARLYEMTDLALSRRLEEITVLTNLAHTLATVALDPAQVAEQTLCGAAEPLQAAKGILIHCDETGKTLTPLARLRWSSIEEWQEIWPALLPDLLAAGPGTLLYRTADPQSPPFPEQAAPLQLLCPLIREDTLLAFIHLSLPAEAEPGESRRRFLRHLADHAAIALENALLYQQQVQQRQALDQRARHLAEILHLSNALRANIELEQVLQFVVEAVRDTLGFRTALLSLVEEDMPSQLQWVATVGLDPDLHAALQAERLPLSYYQQMMQSQFRISHSYLIGPEERAVSTSTPERQGGPVSQMSRRILEDWANQALMLIPLRGAEERLLGILMVYTPQDQATPGQDTIEMLEIFANQAAVAIENARLYQALREANEAKSEFLSIVAHELRMPMGAIWGYADLLSQEMPIEDEATRRGFLQVIKANITRLDGLVNDLLDVSRIEAGKASLSLAPLNPREIIMDSVANFRPQIERKGLTLTLDVSAGIPTVLGDRGRLTQVLDNILSNAWKYTPPPGSISVSASFLRQAEDLNGAGPEQASVRCPCVLISVQDSGIGLSHQERKRLFTRFFRSDHPVVRQEEGTGLGLYLVHLLVESHKGQVWVESEPGRGSTFHLALPVIGTGKPLAPS